MKQIIGLFVLPVIAVLVMVACGGGGENDISVKAALPNLVAYPVYDNFARSDRILDGDIAPTGETWMVTGLGQNTAAIENGILVSPDNMYGYLSLGESIKEITGVFSFVHNAGIDNPMIKQLTLIADKNKANPLNDMLHLNIGPMGWTLMKRLSGGVFVVILGNSFNLRTDGTVYGITMEIVDNTVTVIDPWSFRYSVTDTDIGVINAKDGCIQISPSPDAFTGRWHGIGMK